MHVAENGALGGGIDARREVVEQQHAGVERERAGQHDALLLAAGKAGAALGNHGLEALRQGGDEIVRARRWQWLW